MGALVSNHSKYISMKLIITLLLATASGFGDDRARPDSSKPAVVNNPGEAHRLTASSHPKNRPPRTRTEEEKQVKRDERKRDKEAEKIIEKEEKKLTKKADKQAAKDAEKAAKKATKKADRKLARSSARHST